MAGGLYSATALRKRGAEVTVYANHQKLKQACMQASQPKRESLVAVLGVGVPCIVLCHFFLWVYGKMVKRSHTELSGILPIDFPPPDPADSGQSWRCLD